MSLKSYDLAIFIGRLQPFHLGHLDTLEFGASIADHVLVLVGSSHRPRTLKNPFTYLERKRMITQSLEMSGKINDFTVLPLVDALYDDDDWADFVSMAVQDLITKKFGKKNDLRVALIGFEKDKSSYYLSLFPQWDYVATPAFHIEGQLLNATDIRQYIYKQNDRPFEAVRGLEKFLPQGVLTFLSHFQRDQPDIIGELIDDDKHFRNLKTMSGEVEVEGNFILMTPAHVLLEKRAGFDGNELYQIPTLPLHFMSYLSDPAKLDKREFLSWLVDTGIVGSDVSIDQLQLDHVHHFDHPDRNDFALGASKALLLNLDYLPIPQASNQADYHWVKLNDLQADQFYADGFDQLYTLSDKVRFDYKAMLATELL